MHVDKVEYSCLNLTRLWEWWGTFMHFCSNTPLEWITIHTVRWGTQRPCSLPRQGLWQQSPIYDDWYPPSYRRTIGQGHGCELGSASGCKTAFSVEIYLVLVCKSLDGRNDCDMRFDHIEYAVEVFESHSRTLRLHLDCVGESRRQVWTGDFLSQFFNCVHSCHRSSWSFWTIGTLVVRDFGDWRRIYSTMWEINALAAAWNSKIWIAKTGLCHPCLRHSHRKPRGLANETMTQTRPWNIDSWIVPVYRSIIPVMTVYSGDLCDVHSQV
jgi:hypothetical protein